MTVKDRLIGRPVLVRWRDAYSHLGWLQNHEVDQYLANPAPGAIQSVGWLIQRNTKRVVIATSLSELGGSAANLTDVPRGMVKSIRRLG